MPDRPQQLAHLEHLGDATQFAAQMHALIPKCALLENFSPAEVELLAHFMDVYRAAGATDLVQLSALLARIWSTTAFTVSRPIRRPPLSTTGADTRS